MVRRQNGVQQAVAWFFDQVRELPDETLLQYLITVLEDRDSAVDAVELREVVAGFSSTFELLNLPEQQHLILNLVRQVSQTACLCYMFKTFQAQHTWRRTLYATCRLSKRHFQTHQVQAQLTEHMVPEIVLHHLQGTPLSKGILRKQALQPLPESCRLPLVWSRLGGRYTSILTIVQAKYQLSTT